MSELLVNIYDTLAETKLIQLTDQQQTKLFQLRELVTIHQIQSPPLRVGSSKSSPPSSPFLIRSRAQPNLCSSFASACDQPQSTSLPQLPFELNINKKLISTNTYFHS